MKRIQYIVIALLSVLSCNIFSHQSGQQETATQTFRYLHHFRHHPRLGKYFLFLQAMEHEQQYKQTHTSVYVPLNTYQFMKYLYYVGQYQNQGMEAPYVQALFSATDDRDHVIGYCNFAHAYKMTDDRTKVTMQGVFDNCHVKPLLREWNRGIVVQLHIPIKHSCVQYMYHADSEVSSVDIQGNNDMSQFSDIDVNVLHPVYTASIQNDISNEIQNRGITSLDEFMDDDVHNINSPQEVIDHDKDVKAPNIDGTTTSPLLSAISLATGILVGGTPAIATLAVNDGSIDMSTCSKIIFASHMAGIATALSADANKFCAGYMVGTCYNLAVLWIANTGESITKLYAKIADVT